MKDKLDLYTDYLLLNFGQASATGLFRLVDGELPHVSITTITTALIRKAAIGQFLSLKRIRL